SDRRKASHETRIVFEHPAHLRLLQHEFGDEDGIGVASFPPRQAASRFLVPNQQLTDKHPRLISHVNTTYRAMSAFTAALDLRRYVGRWSLRSASHAGRSDHRPTYRRRSRARSEEHTSELQ